MIAQYTKINEMVNYFFITSALACGEIPVALVDFDNKKGHVNFHLRGLFI